MSEITISMSGLGQYTLNLDLHDQPDSSDPEQTEVWRATFCDKQSEDCEVVYFEMGQDYELWDLIDEAIQTYRVDLMLE